VTDPATRIVDRYLDQLAITFRSTTVKKYAYVLTEFVQFLRNRYPRLRPFSKLKRRPPIEAWLVSLAKRDRPIKNCTRRNYIIHIRRFLTDLWEWEWPNAPCSPDLILSSDLPPAEPPLPRALSPRTDAIIQKALRESDQTLHRALLLARLTGVRVGELIRLERQCLTKHDGSASMRVPLGKLHTERVVPLDPESVQLIESIAAESADRPHAVDSRTGKKIRFLLCEPCGRHIRISHVRRALDSVCLLLGIEERVTPHRLRHTYATDLIRFGAPLTAVMRLLGHKDVRMTMRYVAVTQQDVNRAFHLASQQARERYPEMEILSASLPILQTRDPQAAVPEHFSELIMSLNRLHLDEECPDKRKRLQRFVERMRRACRDFEALIP
jgi:integrase